VTSIQVLYLRNGVVPDQFADGAPGSAQFAQKLAHEGTPPIPLTVYNAPPTLILHISLTQEQASTVIKHNL